MGAPVSRSVTVPSMAPVHAGMSPNSRSTELPIFRARPPAVPVTVIVAELCGALAAAVRLSTTAVFGWAVGGIWAVTPVGSPVTDRFTGRSKPLEVRTDTW